MISVRDLAWLAGLLEGEGCFLWSHTTPCIALSMSDKDVVTKAANLMGVKVRGPYQPKGKPHYKPVWICNVTGSRAASWMMTLLTLMGERRFEKIAALIRQWADSPGFPRGSVGGKRKPATCHPDRQRTSDGLCRQCYYKQWRANKRALALA